MQLDLITLVVEDYDAAIEFFVDKVGFELVEDSPTENTEGVAKRWVVVRPPAGGAGLLLARADASAQRRVVGRQAGGRVMAFLHVEDFDAAHARMTAAGVHFLEAPRDESYGRVAVFEDVAGNRWDLLGRRTPTA